MFRNEKTLDHSVGLSVERKIKPQGVRGSMGVWRGVSKGVEDGRRMPTLWAGHPCNGCKAISGVARPQSVEGLGMTGPRETLGISWTPLATRLREEEKRRIS
jgi:hypothetical protein